MHPTYKASKHQKFNQVIQALDPELARVLSKDVIKKARKFYWKKARYGITSLELYALASIFAAVKTSECLPISLTKFSMYYNPGSDKNDSTLKTSNTRMVAIGKVYRKIVERENLKVNVCTVQPTIFVDSGCKALKLSNRVRGFARRVNEAVMKKRLHIGKNPSVVAGGIVYLTCLEHNIKKCQRDIGEVFRITEVSVRNSYKRIMRDPEIASTFENRGNWGLDNA